CQHYFNTPYTF
nr:immunoglobulin light chain junction region [Macaca mulatta]MOY11075.1 immunoglobulin light chain junction region [Macaca mulatta]MOY11151.1 immunoglobulin light chain junction region [Macaca mulatta]MOY11320.1 immunoglobulin light chain junction region [Macaca mulatta]MOY11563.1 immunoglobulin light chain junction region [Macaca mulatta]